MKNQKNNASTIAGLIFVGCMFIGMGLGFLFDKLVIGLFIGMGTGFIGMAIAYGVFFKRNPQNETEKE